MGIVNICFVVVIRGMILVLGGIAIRLKTRVLVVVVGITVSPLKYLY